MYQTKIKDIEDWKQKRQQMISLQKKIDALSTFDLKLIGDIIARLMSEFEGTLYWCIKNDSWFDDDYLVKPKIYQKEFLQIYPIYKLKKLYNKEIFDKKEKEILTFLPPSSSLFNYDAGEINTSYIQYFINFLYNKRSSNSLYEITNEDLEIILQEFLLDTRDLQQRRKEEITRKNEERRSHQKRLEFENSCMISRKLIYNSLTYIINHYEDTMTVVKEYEEDWKRSSQWSERYLYQNLIINDGITKVSFQTVIDHEGCYPDEEYCGVYVNRNKDTNICFFDLKKAITPILKSSTYVAMFMNMIENLYNKNINVSSENIQQILVLISNNWKEKKRVLKKEIL